MTVKSLKLGVFITLVGSFVLAVLILFTLYRPNLFSFSSDEVRNEFSMIFVKIVGIYSVHISVAISSYFSSDYKASTKKADERDYIACSVILLWIFGFSGYIVFNGVNLPSGDIKFEDIYRDLDTVSTTFGFLIAAALVYLFAGNRKIRRESSR